MLGTIAFFILIFGMITLAHELGHYLLARRNGIHVTEFFVGMGPSLFSFTRKGTKYSLKLFPIGGACVFEGDNALPEKEVPAESLEEKGALPIQKEPGEGSYLKASAWGRLSTLLAGPVFNFLLAYLIGLLIVGNRGIDLPIIETVTPGSPAEAAGLQPGDRITRVNRENIHLYRQIYFISYTGTGEILEVTYERNGTENQTAITPVYSKEAGRYLMGISASGYYTKEKGFAILRDALYEVEFGVTSTLKSLSMLVQGMLSKDDVAGPLGMATVIGETYEEAKPYGAWTVILSMLNITMILSVNLGIMNLLPLPALDGGRLVFVVVELIRGKAIAPEKEGLVHLAGLIALMILMVIVLFNDITRIF